MKAALMFENKKPLVMGDYNYPEPDRDEVVVKVGATGICRSDWHYWNGDWEWMGVVPTFPHILGHEMAGIVEEIGPDVRKFRKGDRVVVPFALGCGKCRPCSEGHQNVCENMIPLGFTCMGSFAEYASIPRADTNLAMLPDSISFSTAASLGCRYMTSYHGIVDQIRLHPGESFAVFGAGGVGMAAIQIASSMGALPIAVDIDDNKLRMAEDMGAVATLNSSGRDAYEIAERINELTEGGADCTLDALGIEATCVPAVMSLKQRGRHLQIGLTTGDQAGMTTLPTDVIVTKELQFTGSFGMPPHRYRELLGLITSGKLHPEKLVTRKVALEEAGSVLESMTGYNTIGTVVIDRF